MKSMRIFFSLLLIVVMSSPLSALSRSVNGNALLFSGNANPELSKKVAQELGIPLGNAKVARFNDGEIQIHIDQNVRNKDIYIVQPTCPSADQSINDNLMELFLLIRTMKRASAHSITVIAPYYGYARQDRKLRARVPISAADVATMIEHAGATRVVTIDLHCGQIQGFFQNVPCDNLYASMLFAPYMAQQDLQNIVVVSPDAGGVERANQFIHELSKQGVTADMAVISKQREKAGVVGSMHLIGDVKGADAIIVDDMCDTGGTLCKAAQLLKDKGARRIFAVITHPVFSNQALETIGNSVIDQMVVADTIPLRGKAPENITVISMAALLADAIACLDQGESLSALFR